MALSGIFLKVDGIKGESTDDKHKDEIDVLNYTFTVSNKVSFPQGTDGEAGKSETTAIRVTKCVDASTPSLVRACCKGTRIAEIKLVVRRANGTPLEYLAYTMKSAFVSSVMPYGSNGDTKIIEEVFFTFAELHIDYETQDGEGRQSTHHAMGYNFATNADA